MKPLKILSLGAGVQSSTLLLMSIKGQLPKIDACVFADTKWEPKEVYEHYDFLREEAKDSGIPIYSVSGGDLKTHVIEGQVRGKKSEGQREMPIPLHVLKPDGTKGMVSRQCTSRYKVDPINRFIKTELLGIKPKGRWPTEVAVDLWFGISADEMRRIRSPDALWKRHVYPLCNLPFDYLDVSYNRQRCVAWLAEHYEHHRIPRSACLGCPFKSNTEWRYLRDQFPEEWEETIQVDESLRADGKNNDSYLHASLTPLKDAILGDENQLSFEGFEKECLGYCGN